jgi:TonB family protein
MAMHRARSAPRIFARLVVTIVLLVDANSLLAQETTPLEAKFAVPRPLVIVPPDYPAKALAEGRTAEIRLSGTITRDGILESAVFSNGPGEEEFVEAVRTVLKMWRFVPGTDSHACSAVPLDASVRIWFEIKDNKPAIFVSVPPADDEKIVAKKESGPEKKLAWYRRPKAVYPSRALRAGVEGITYVLVRVEKSGEITEAGVLASSPVRVFGEEAVRATRRAQYEPFDPNVWGKESICGRLEFRFCIRAGASYPIPQCSPSS